MKFVQQRKDTDCTVAALAMFCNKDYGRIVALLDEEAKADYDNNKGMNSVSQYEVCDKLDMEVYFYSLGDFDKSKPAILSVPSLNNEGNHAVVWTGTELLDPNTGREGKCVYRKDKLPEHINNVFQESKNDNRTTTTT